MRRGAGQHDQRRAHGGEQHPGLEAAVGPEEVGPATSPHRAFESTPTLSRARACATDRLHVMRLLVLGGTVFLGRHVDRRGPAPRPRGHALPPRPPRRRPLPRGRARPRRPRRRPRAAARARVGRRHRHERLRARRRRALERAGPRPSGLRLELQRLPRVAGRAGRRGQPGVDRGRRLRPAEGGLRARRARPPCPGASPACGPGSICGPHDNIFRLPWWVQRIAAGGDVVAPGDPERTVQLVDARDLAAWMLDLAERRIGGRLQRHRAARAHDDARGARGRGAGDRQRRAAALGARRRPRGPRGRAVGRAAAVDPARRPARGRGRSGTERAQAAGLRCRPVAETVADTWAWLRDGGAEAMGDWRAENRPRGLSPERERELLAV